MPEKPFLSLCMIAKNEEKWLKTSLASAKIWVDEIILVDTGSTDRTVELAKQYGAKVFHHPWQDNFALHRNQSIAHAKGKWILILDADEQLDQKTAPFLKNLSQWEDKCEAFYVEINHLSNDGAHTIQATPRLIRKTPDLAFEGRIHESLTGLKGKSLRSPLRLIHYGFAQGAEVMRQKAMRNLNLIEQWIESEPENPAAYTYKAQTLMVWPETCAKAFTAGLKALTLAKKQNMAKHLLPRIYHPIWISLTQMKRYGEVVLWAQECRNLLPDYPDSYYSLSWAQFHLEHWELTRTACQTFMNLQDHWKKNALAYPYTQNLTLNLRHEVVRRWILADARINNAHQEACVLFKRLQQEDNGLQTARAILQELEQTGFKKLGNDLEKLL